MAQADLLNTITNVLALSLNQRKVLSDGRYDTISTIIHWKYDNIHEWFTTKSKLATNRGGSSYGDQKIKCLQALEWWAADLTLRVKHIVLADFGATIMADCTDEAKLYNEDENRDPDIEKPDKFSHSKSVYWEEMVYTYFITMKNI